jgi:nucleoid-associated protein YgaU
MGVFDFVVTAGKKLFGPDDAEAAKSADPGVMAKRSAALENEITSLGLAVEGLKVKVAGDTAHVRGKVKTEADREKVVLALGNVAGVAKVDDGGLEVTSPGEAARMYTVQKGDTLSKIAKEHYGDANRYHAIFEANRPMLAHPDKIYPGQVLRIPSLG